jgi:hypothetical protein
MWAATAEHPERFGQLGVNPIRFPQNQIPSEQVLRCVAAVIHMFFTLWENPDPLAG